MTTPLPPHALIRQSLNRWHLYKRAFILFIALNVFAVITALVVAVHYFGGQRQFHQQQQQRLQQLQHCDTSLHQLHTYSQAISQYPNIQLNTPAGQEQLNSLIQQWAQLKQQAQQLTPNPLENTPLLLPPQATHALPLLQQNLLQQKNQLYTQLQQQQHRYTQNTRLLIISGSLTLIFGVFLPLAGFYILGRSLNALRLSLQKAALDCLREYQQQRAFFGEGAFRNWDFWLQCLLITATQAPLFSKHPAAQALSEIAFLIRSEWQKQGSTKDTPSYKAE